MKTLISIFLVLTAALSFSQTKISGAKITVEVDPVFNKVTVKLKTDSDSLTNCKVQITDSKKNIVKTVELPKATKQAESSVAIADLEPGNYTCFVYQGKDELYKKEFFKDAILMEPQTQPTSKN